MYLWFLVLEQKQCAFLGCITFLMKENKENIISICKYLKWCEQYDKLLCSHVSQTLDLKL